MKSFIKKGASFLLAVTVAFLCFTTREAKADTYLEPVGGTREVVLVLDSSGSMQGTPMTAMKTAAKKFCDQLLSAEGYNKVSIVVYSSSVMKVLDFTSEPDEARTFINSLSAGGGTNIYSGLYRAKQILDESANETAVKNIVMLTDGMPENGPTLYSGKYNDLGPSYSYRYGNYLYDYFNNNLKDGYNVYSLGFFHALSGSNLTYAETLLNDIQNKGFYEVTDPDDLVFTFGDVAADIIDTEESNCPIIIVPGVMGSQLYDSRMDLIWVDYGRIGNPFYRLDSHMAMDQYLKVKNYNYGTNGREDPINQAELAIGSREYGATGIYKDLVDGIIEEFTDADGSCTRSVYFFSYDFRKSNDDNSAELNSFISDVLHCNQGYSRVDIVAHSMGGLVVSDYVSDWGSSSIRKVITCGTPYEGAPKLVNSVLTTKVLDGTGTNLALWALGGLTKATKASFPAIAELAPTERYFLKNSLEFKRYTGKTWTSPFTYVKNYQTLSLSEYQTINSIIFGVTNMFDAMSFHEGILSSEGYNLLASLSNSYFIVGINQKTISGITYEVGSKLSDTKVVDVTYETKGDGTVPYDSSTMIEKLESLPAERFIKINTTHAGVAGKSGESNAGVALGKILDILADRMNAPTTDDLINEGYIVVKIACPVDVTVEYNGETICSDPENLRMNTSYGVLDFLGEEMEIKTMCLDIHDYNIVLNGTGDGTMDYTIRFFNEEGVLEAEYEFNEVSVTPSTIITTGSDRNNIVLNVDKDGDGSTDSVLVPGVCEGNGTLIKNGDSSLTFDSDDYKITYEVVSRYGDNYNVDVTITNKTTEVIHNWMLAYDSTDEIDRIWNGQYGAYEGYTLIKNAGYNQDIPAGGTVSFGFIATKTDEISYPSRFKILENESDAQNADYETAFDILSDWESGYHGRITITNKSNEVLSDWILSFDFDEEIDNLWNGVIVAKENGTYVVRNASYNHNINPGESISFEFTVPVRRTGNKPANYRLSTIN